MDDGRWMNSLLDEMNGRKVMQGRHVTDGTGNKSDGMGNKVRYVLNAVPCRCLIVFKSVVSFVVGV